MRARMLLWIAAYRTSGFAARTAGCCRYERSCSHYAEDVLATRALPVALWLVVLRVLSCRRPMSRTTRRKVGAVLLLSGLVTLGTAGLAQAVSPVVVPPTATRGGCTMAVGGSDIGGYNRNNPFLVTKGKRVQVDGLAPPQYRNAPEPPGATTDLTMDFEVVSPVKTSYKGKTLNGYKAFNTSVNVDDYLELGSGLYRITAKAAGHAGGRTPWTCAATFYVKLDGSPVPGLVAGALGLAGAAAAATATGKSDWQVGDEVPQEETVSEKDMAGSGSIDAVKQSVEPDQRATLRKDAGAMGCVLAIFAGVFGYEPAGAAAVLALDPEAADDRRIWRRGHTVRGFLGGLLLGLGVTGFMQQRGYWLLTWVDVIAFPLALGLVLGWRAWKGRAFRVISTPPSGAAAAEPAPAIALPADAPAAPAVALPADAPAAPAAAADPAPAPVPEATAPPATPAPPAAPDPEQPAPGPSQEPEPPRY